MSDGYSTTIIVLCLGLPMVAMLASLTVSLHRWLRVQIALAQAQQIAVVCEAAERLAAHLIRALHAWEMMQATRTVNPE